MTRTLTRPAPSRTRREDRPDETGLTRGCEILLDLVVVVLATWTLVYHLCLLLRLAVPWAVALELAALSAWVVVAWRVHRARDVKNAAAVPTSGTEPSLPTPVAESSRLETALLTTNVTCAVVAALLFAVSASWPVIAVLWLAAALSGTAWAVIGPGRARQRRAASDLATPDTTTSESVTSDTATSDTATSATAAEPGSGPGRPLSTMIALGWAFGLAALSTFTIWPNPDDLYYVNLSQWVVDHGNFPVRDTIFSDLVFPMSSWPPMASYDALVGTIARLGGVHAATVAYIAVPPLATFMAVLALWRLLRAWRVKALGLALSLALLFLLFDGGFGYAAPGNLFLIRIWQGKVILLCVLVPILLVYVLQYVERPTWGRAGWLFAGGVAAVGLSTTAMFLVPLLALGGAAPLLRRHPLLALRGFGAMAAYPLATGAFTVAVGGRSADLFDTRELYRFNPEWFGHEIFRHGVLTAIVVAAVLVGALLVPHPAAKVTTGVLTVVTGITFIPGFTHLSYDLVGLGPTLWRVSWVASIAALVGVLGSQSAVLNVRRSLQVAGPLVLVAALVGLGTPIVAERNGVNLVSPPHWQRGRESVASAQHAIAAARPGDVILAPEQVAITIDVLTTRVKTVAPRDYFMDYLRDDPSFHYHLRLDLIHFANREANPTNAEVTRALNVLGVDEVCLPRRAFDRIIFIRSLGYQPVDSAPWYSCLRR